MPPDSSRPPRLTLAALYAAAVLAGIWIVVSMSPVVPNDFWWHAAAGRWMVANGQIPRVDLFSFTQGGQPWAYQSWLMEIALYLALRSGGLPLAVALHALAVTAAYGILMLTSRTAAGGNLRWAALATLAAALASPNWNLRPQTLSLPLFALALLLLERHARRPAGPPRPRLVQDPALWLLPPVFLLWANGHGGFVFGLALLGCYSLAGLWDWRRHGGPFPLQLLAVALASGLAALVTPLGLGMAPYVLEFMRNPVTRLHNVEFLPTTVRSPDGQLFFAFVLLLLALLWLSRYPLAARQALPLLLFGLLALMSRRNAVWFCFTAAPLLAASMSRLAEARGRGALPPGRPAFNRALALLLALVALLALPWLRPYVAFGKISPSLLAEGTPVEAVAALCQMPEARRAFNEQGYGVYMTWACPQKPVFIDTRLELYPLAQWLDYQAISDARYDWQQLLARYQIDTLLLNREGQPHLIDAATASPDWRLVYEDERAVIFQRAADAR